MDVPTTNHGNIDTNTASFGQSSSKLQHFLTLHPFVRFLRCQWQDYSGVLRARVVPIKHGLSIAAQQRSLHVPPCAFHLTVTSKNIPSLDPRGHHRLVPDWSSLYTRPSLDPGYASVMCSIVESIPARPDPNSDLCPRRALMAVIDKAKNTLHVDFLVGFEVEFQIMRAAATGRLEPHSKGIGRCAVSGLRDPCYSQVEEVVSILMETGIGVGAFQMEGDRGQFEIALDPQPPLQAIDQLISVHDTLKSVFSRQGLIATMSPRPVELDKQAAGQHTHLSLNPPNMEAPFLAGVLSRLPALCAFCLPYDVSYERVQPYQAGHVVSWGSDNRAVAIRKIKAGHFELRCVDATANMYLALASIFSAGLLGFTKGESLIWPDTGFISEHFPADGTPLPRSIEQSLESLESISDELEEIMGPNIVRHYIEIKRCDASELGSMESESVRQLFCELF